jgi:hypothetical protein
MSTSTATRPVTLAPPIGEGGLRDEAEQARLENLESLPARLEPEALAQVMDLHEQRKTPKTIGGRLSLHPLIVSIEVRRELQRRAEEQQAAQEHDHNRVQERHQLAEMAGSSEQESPALLSRLEMNRLAKGSYIPNKPIRAIVDRVLARRPGTKLSTVLREFGVTDTTHAKRLLGYSPYSGAARPAATISVEHATRLLDAFGHDPVDVAGL